MSLQQQQQQWPENVAQRPSETQRPASASGDVPTRPTSAAVLSPLPRGGDLHPNQEVVLDEVAEGEMVENKLVIPDEMVHYLSQVKQH